MKIQYLLEGLIDLESDNLKESIEHLEKAESCLVWNWNLNDNAYYLDALARAYYRSGKLASAKTKYQKISITRLFKYHDPVTWVKSFYWLGRIAEERGKKAEAQKHYQEFLELWKDADPGIAEIEDARTRLARLKGKER